MLCRLQLPSSGPNHINITSCKNLTLFLFPSPPGPQTPFGQRHALRLSSFSPSRIARTPSVPADVASPPPPRRAPSVRERISGRDSGNSGTRPGGRRRGPAPARAGVRRASPGRIPWSGAGGPWPEAAATGAAAPPPPGEWSTLGGRPAARPGVAPHPPPARTWSGPQRRPPPPRRRSRPAGTGAGRRGPRT